MKLVPPYANISYARFSIIVPSWLTGAGVKGRIEHLWRRRVVSKTTEKAFFVTFKTRLNRALRTQIVARYITNNSAGSTDCFLSNEHNMSYKQLIKMITLTGVSRDEPDRTMRVSNFGRSRRKKPSLWT